MDDYSLDELKSRLKMSELEIKITTSTGNNGTGSSKKSRKNKTPVFRQQRRPSSGGEENSGTSSPKMHEQNRASSSPESPRMALEAEKRTSALLVNEPPLPPPPGGIKSYSDFMRSLAAKYNNNENGLTSTSESPFQPFKTTSSPMIPPTSVANAQVHPLLGLPSPFPFLGAAAAGLSSLTDPKGQKGHGLHGLPPGFPNMMDIHSTQALLSLARSGSFLQPPVTSSGPPTTVAFSGLTEAKKRPNIVLDSALDLSPPTSGGPKKAKMEAKLSNIAVDASALNWSVSEVCNFVGSIDICKEYTEVFREHNIDGSALPLLTEDHLTLRLGLKLGPALKLRSIIAKKLGPAHADICVHCAHCNSKLQNAENHDTNGPQDEIRSSSRNSSLSEK